MKSTILSLVLIICAFSGGGCGKHSALEGKVVDKSGYPIGDATVVARQLKPIKGYDEVRAVTAADGSFALSKLFPQSQYELRVEGKNWISHRSNSDTIKSGPEGETTLLVEPITVTLPVNETGSLIMDLETGICRFEKSSDGYIDDVQSALQWYVLPGKITWFEAREIIDQMGEGWRLPSTDELKGLYVKGLGEASIDPVFGLEYGDLWSDFYASSVWTNYLKRLPFNLTISHSFYFPTAASSSSGAEPNANEDHMRAFAVRSLEAP